MSDTITVTFPDGSQKQYPRGITALAVAKDLGPKLGKDALVAKVGDHLVDLTAPITHDTDLKILTFEDPNGKDTFRHSTAHVFACAVEKLYPNALKTIGPPVEEGFYYDFDKLDIKEEDFARIEEEMKKIVKEDIPFSRVELTLDEVKQIFSSNPYKIELAEEHAAQGQTLSAYKFGDEFIDLCTGPHVPSTGYLQAIKLTKIAGAYWRGDANNTQLTRVYGISFPNKKQLQEHLDFLEEVKKRDHREISKRLKIFDTCEEIGPGLVLWLPNGNVIKEQLENWAKETEQKEGYKRVTTPILTKEGLFHTSEHLPHYKESMFPPMEVEGENFYIKPMNCPFHHMIFKSGTRSYRELPLRLAEYGWCHRYEQSGTLFGLMRVRGMQMNDAHIYCTKEQAVEEFVKVIKLHEYYYKTLGIQEYWMELALRNPENDKYHGDEAMWKEAEELMMEAMEKSGVKYIVEQDGAAFYGPKVDFQIKSVIGRTFTASTNQIDLFMPDKFGLKYVGSDGHEHTPVVIHRAPLGTHERFIGFLLEHYAGKLPLWLSPVQVRIITVADRFNEYAEHVCTQMGAAGLRAEVDTRSESVSKKVREAQLDQVNYILVVGEKEAGAGTVTVRTRSGEILGAQETEALIAQLLDEVKRKV